MILDILLERLPSRMISGLTMLLALFALAVSAGVIWLGLQFLSQPSPVRWIYDTYHAPVPLCPGDVIEYEVAMEVARPAALAVVVAILRADPDEASMSDEMRNVLALSNYQVDGDTLRGQRMGEVFSTVIPTARILADGDGRFVVPDLPPGQYIRALAALELYRNSEPAIRMQPFVIRDGCGD